MNGKLSLEENIKWLLEQYKKELEIEKESKEPNSDIINAYENVIIELGFALEVSRKESGK